MEAHPHKATEEQGVTMAPSSPAVVQAEVDYGSSQQQDSDRGHVTIEAPTKDAGDLHDWEMLSRNPSPAPERSDDIAHSDDAHREGQHSSLSLGPHAQVVDHQEEGDGTATDGGGPAARAEVVEEEAQMTIDAVPELVQMMTDIQAALAEPESFSGPEDSTSETEDVQDAPPPQGGEPIEEISQAIETPFVEGAESIKDNDDAAEGTPPDSPHVRSGVSSFSHVSSPASYQFSRDGDASDEEGSSWSTDEDGKSRGSGRRSEADSEEAVQDVCALSQEGSLGSFSASDRSSARAIEAAAESSRATSRSMAALSRLRSPSQTDLTSGPVAGESPAAVEDALKVARRLSEEVLKVAGLSEDEGEGKQASEKAAVEDGAHKEDRWDAKGSRRADVVGALRSGLDKLAEVSNKALTRVGNSDLLHRFWACLEEWMAALLNCLPAAQRARARLRMELSRMQARAKRMGLSQIALVASLAIMAIVAGVAVVKNAALSRAMHRKNQEMNQLILMVFNLQESLQNAAAGSRVPIVRHASCGLGSFSAYGYAEPVSMLAFEALTGTVQC